ncbi:MAG: hypothetical protein SP1CHLAM54_08990 [Chlamydiia bacterium]|nr:hypothetical protein [Chlamydiia bacterium]MCH9615805.1 hypothetical protein [Chlamydiia bacterium]MCH9628792.1 hypothetical protein [Chlamydiia bacterium]
MRRSICFAEPKTAPAGALGDWKFVYAPSSNLPKGTMLLFDVLSKGRDMDWDIPSHSAKAKKNALHLALPDGKTIHPKTTDIPTQFEFTLPAEIEQGQQITFCLTENRVQTNTQRRRPFYLHIDPKGKGDYRESEVFNIDVRGGELASIRLLTPSIVSRNQRFDITVRFEDAYGNLTGTAPEGTMIELSYEQLRDNINWKLFVPETGFIILPNLYFNEDGIYRIRLENLNTKEVFLSWPIKCFDKTTKEAFWGLFHGESKHFDTEKNVESALRHFRDDDALQFYAPSPFEDEESTPSEIWKSIGAQVAECNEEDRFVTFLGLQWAGEAGLEGLHNIVYLKDNKPILRKKESKSNGLKKIYKSHTTKDFFSIPSFTMAKGMHYDFTDHASDYETAVEIYNAWGSSECLAKEDNPRPITGKGKNTYQETAKGSLREALNRGCRFGFVAGGLDDRGIFSKLFDADQTRYTPGLTCILAESHSRDDIAGAIAKRSCYATTGERIIVGLYVAKLPMGSELSTEEKPGLVYNRHISGYVIGTKKIREVIIYRNGQPFKKLTPKDHQIDFAIDDTESIEKTLLKGPADKPPFVYYYLRAIQDDDHIAWSSPIWVDHPAAPPTKKRK